MKDFGQRACFDFPFRPNAGFVEAGLHPLKPLCFAFVLNAGIVCHESSPALRPSCHKLQRKSLYRNKTITQYNVLYIAKSIKM